MMMIINNLRKAKKKISKIKKNYIVDKRNFAWLTHDYVVVSSLQSLRESVVCENLLN